MRFMLQYPEAQGTEVDLLDAGSVTDIAVAAERAGWGGLAFTEHPAPSQSWLNTGGHQSIDPFVGLAAAAAVTTELKLLTFLTVVPYRNPMLLAKAAATLSMISENRFIMGAGAGYLKSEFFALGVDFEERNALLEESLEVLKLHWSGEAFSYEGRHFNARNVIARPAPKGDIPIWMGGNSNAALRRAAKYASGWMPMTGSATVATTARTTPVDSIEAIIERLGVLKEYAGDRYDSLDLVIGYHADGVEEFDKDVERHRDGIGQLAELGAKWIAVGPPWSPDPGPTEWIQRFAETFITA